MSGSLILFQTVGYVAVDLFVDIFNGPHFAVPDALDDGPAVVVCGGFSGAAAGSKVLDILLVDVGVGIGIGFPAAHHGFGEVSGHIQIKDQIRAGKPQFVVFKIIEPVQEFLLLICRI